jgi:hypothetical protein
MLLEWRTNAYIDFIFFLELGMYICSQSGELVHPIHLKHLSIDDGGDHELDNNNGAPVNLCDDDSDHEDDNTNGSLTRGKPVDRG